MTKRINTEKAPAAIGPYSQGVAAGNFLSFPASCRLTPRPAASTRTRGRPGETVSDNLSQILEAAGTSMDQGGQDHRIHSAYG